MKTRTSPTGESVFHLLYVFLVVAALAAGVRADDSAAPARDINASEPLDLRAGPIRAKFQDGQLRYLRAGDREIVRRVYFAVRDGNWATIPPRFTQASIRQTSDSFEIDLAAECRRGPVNYKWTGQIKGTPDGKITYHAEGTADADFQSNRIGLCVLFGLPSVAQEAFETFDSVEGNGTPTPGRFPQLVSPDLVGKKFKLLRYKSPEGNGVSVSLDGAVFDMEDQRNWGDSSFKAYAPLPYAYPAVKKGEKFAQSVTITASGTAGLDKYVDREVVHLRIGGQIAGSKVPKVELHGGGYLGPSFVDINRNRDKYADAASVTWHYTSATHLPDDDTLMENPPALVDQANTIRSFAPKAALIVAPIRVEQSLQRHDPSAVAPLAAAWFAEVLEALSTAGVDEAHFNVEPGPAAHTLFDIGAHDGKPVLSVEPVADPGSVKQAWAVRALAVKDGETTIVWLVNRTPEKAQAVIEGLGQSAKITQLSATTDASGGKAIDVTGGTAIPVDLEPYGVYRVEPKR
jgi:hypothetical protein